MKTLRLIVLCLTISNADVAFGQSIIQLGPNYFSAGIPTEEFESWAAAEHSGRQRQTNWCWAACVQMVLNYHGLYVTQEQIVQRIYGNLVDQPAGQQQIMNALSGWAPNYQGGVSQIFCQSGLTSINDITNNLAYKWPLIVGLSNPQGGIGHAYVLTAIYYSTDLNNNTIPDKVILRDPWPNSPSRQEMSWVEFSNRVMMVFKVWVTR
jgi:hypothetical protein